MSSIPAYVELHCHSAFSFLDGAALPDDLVLRAAELGYPALALTDHNGLYGSMEFARHAKAAGIQPITGAELTVGGSVLAVAGGGGAPCAAEVAGSRAVGGARNGAGSAALGGSPPAYRPLPASEGAEDPIDEGFHLTLLVETLRGYANLCRLISAAYRGREKGRAWLDPSLLPAHAEGIICLSGCKKGEVARLIDAGRYREAEEVARRLRDWFGRDRFFLELQQNLARGDTRRVRALARLAERLGVGCVATNNAHYHVRERHRLQDALVAVRHRTTVDGCHRQRRENSEYHLKPAAEMAALFADHPEALRNALAIAERCAGFDITQDIGYRFPDFDRANATPAAMCGAPLAVGAAAAESADEVLARICYAALEERYRTGAADLVGAATGELSAAGEPAAAGAAAGPGALYAEARRRLDEELRLVRLHGMSGFFLIYRDLMLLAARVAEEVRGPSAARSMCHLPPARGRGSSVGSIICYLLGLSSVDPVKAKLFLGRFLNEEMASVPDIDLDFPRDIRERLILAVHEKYGREHTALVCSFPTYHTRSAVRDLGKALGLPDIELDKLAKLSEGWDPAELRAEMERLPEFRERVGAPLWRDLIDLAAQISGFPRHVSQHVGGMIISSRPLVEVVPIEPARMAGRQVCQWDKDSCDDARFVKVDFLALGMLSLVEECVEHVYQRTGQALDLSRIDFDDRAVYDDICRADTVGVFQIESRAQMQMLPRTQPRSLEDLAVEVAIVRPGPIVGGAVHPYVARRQRQRLDPAFEPEFDHPLLKEALGETLGVILFQDQVLQVAIALAGFTPGQADSLRRAMSRKRSRAALEGFWRQFRAGAAAKGVDEATAAAVFKKLVAFSEFGFPKSHSAAFAVLAYQSAWLRHYHPAEFYAALFNNQPMGFYPPHVLARDAQRHGVGVLGPDVNRSRARCAVEDVAPGRAAVRVGLGYVRGLGAAAAAMIEAERDRGGPFRSLSDFVRRVHLRREALENVIAVGGFDCFGVGRRELLWQLGLIELDRPLRRRGVEVARQLVLPLPTEPDMVRLPDMQPWERMLADYALLQLSPEHHPLGLLRPRLRRGIARVADLESMPDGRPVTVAGLVVARQRPGTAKGFVFVLLEDESGVVNVIVRPQLYERRRPVVRAEPLVVVSGTLQRRDGVTNLLALDYVSLGEAALIERAGVVSLSGRGGRGVGAAHAAGERGHPGAVAHAAEQVRAIAPRAHNFG